MLYCSCHLILCHMSVYILWSYGAATWSHMSVYLLWGCHLILSRNCGFNWHFTEHVPNLYYKSWNNWKRFSPRLGPPYPSRRSHLSGQKDWRKGGGDWFRQCFSPKSYYFLHQQFLIPTSCTHILLYLAQTYFSLHIHWPIIHIIFSFGRIIIDIIVYGRKRKTCIIIRRKINDNVAWWF